MKKKIGIIVFSLIFVLTVAQVVSAQTYVPGQYSGVPIDTTGTGIGEPSVTAGSVNTNANVGFPQVRYTGSGGRITSFSGAVDVVLGILRSLVVVIIALALVYFLWGVAQFIANTDDEKKREEGRKQMMWGLLGLFVMISVWGLVGVLQNTFPLQTGTPTFPTL